MPRAGTGAFVSLSGYVHRTLTTLDLDEKDHPTIESSGHRSSSNHDRRHTSKVCRTKCFVRCCRSRRASSAHPVPVVVGDRYVILTTCNDDRAYHLQLFDVDTRTVLMEPTNRERSQRVRIW